MCIYCKYISLYTYSGFYVQQQQRNLLVHYKGGLLVLADMVLKGLNIMTVTFECHIFMIRFNS